VLPLNSTLYLPRLKVAIASSGTILIGAERTGRMARALEVDPTYVDVGVRRWQHGKNAVLAASGETFETIEEQRAATPAAA
jgi:DNA modification methylase